MKINLLDIARGRRIVAMAARDMALTRQSPRPRKLAAWRRLLRRLSRKP